MSCAIPWVPPCYVPSSVPQSRTSTCPGMSPLPAAPIPPQLPAILTSYQACLMSTVYQLHVLLPGVFHLFTAEWDCQKYKPPLFVCRIVVSKEHWRAKQPSGNGGLVPVEQRNQSHAECNTAVVRLYIERNSKHLCPVMLHSHRLCNKGQPVMYLKISWGFIYSVFAGWEHRF